MMLSDIDLNFDKSFTTSEPKNVEPSSSVGSYTIALAPLALIPNLNIKSLRVLLDSTIALIRYYISKERFILVPNTVNVKSLGW